jgi:hypothetical protein
LVLGSLQILKEFPKEVLIEERNEPDLTFVSLRSRCVKGGLFLSSYGGLIFREDESGEMVTLWTVSPLLSIYGYESLRLFLCRFTPESFDEIKWNLLS